MTLEQKDYVISNKHSAYLESVRVIAETDKSTELDKLHQENAEQLCKQKEQFKTDINHFKRELICCQNRKSVLKSVLRMRGQEYSVAMTTLEKNSRIIEEMSENSERQMQNSYQQMQPSKK